MKKLVFIFCMLFSFNVYSDDSIDITSDNLEIERLDGKATFNGSVKAVYQDMILTAQKLVINYDDKSESDDKIKSVMAFGKVKLVQNQDTVTSEYAEYYPVKNNITFKDSVVMNRNGNILQGEHLVIDTITKKAKMLAGKGQRVKAIYYKPAEKAPEPNKAEAGQEIK